MSKKTQLLIEADEAEEKLRDQVNKGYDLFNRDLAGGTFLQEVKQEFYTWDEYNSSLLRHIFSTEELYNEYSYWGMVIVGEVKSLDEEIGEFYEDLNDKIRRLNSIIERLPLFVPLKSSVLNQKDVMPQITQTKKVFVVHGRNNELKETVARYLTQLDLAPIILHEQASSGRTIIEKFEDHSDASFAIILLSSDDVGDIAPAKSVETLKKRARQNVIFEWGYFVAKLGRRNTCALVAQGVEIPSDMNGIVYLTLDQEGAWKMLLARELKASGINVDLNNAI